MWKSPIYKFRIPAEEGNSESLDLKEVVMDVTGSAPPFSEPSDALKEVLTEVFSSESFTKIESILEFGAAKLKNIPFILKKGKSVCAVEFEEITKNKITKKNIKKCEKYGSKFEKLIFPNPFLSDEKRFDLALLLNVIPVMPVPSERMYLLDLLHEKVKDEKYLLWVAQKEGSYKKIREEGENNCGDGLWMGKRNKLKTFYKYHQVEELDELMALYGFKLVKRFNVGDDARLYQKIKYNLFHNLLNPQRINEEIKKDESIENPTSINLKVVQRNNRNKVVIPNPKSLSIENLYIEKIKSFQAGTNDAEAYHRVVSHALSRIFRKSLRNMEIKVNIDGGVKIIDTVFTNSADSGFFNNLKAKIECTYPMVEVKNTSGDPTNPELDQLNGRLNTNRGHFGILICREVKNEEAVYSKCKTFLPNNCVIFLTDKDLFELLEYSREGDINSINDLMDNRLKRVLF